MPRSEFHVTGMTCAACEQRVTSRLRRIPGVQRVRVDARSGLAQVWSADGVPIDADAVHTALEPTPYDVADRAGPRPWLSRDPVVWRDAAVGLLIVAALAVIASRSGLLDLSGSLADGATVSLLVIFAVGLTAGFSTCMALVGGLVLGVSARYASAHPELAGRRLMAPQLAFNAGRVAGFALLGGVVGALGSGLALDGVTLGVCMVVVGVVLVLLGLQLTQVSPRLATGWVPTLPAGLGRRLGLGAADGEGYRHRGAALLGALSFFLPCGFTQAVQLYALSTGSFVSGALVMGAFALGTAPGLLGVGALTAWLRGPSAVPVFRVVGTVVLAFALVNLLGGLRVLGLAPGGADVVASAPTDNVEMDGATQVVHVTQDAEGYSPKVSVFRAGVPTRLVVTSTSPISCATALRVPDLGIRTSLRAGDNVFEFTADQPEVIDYNCAMGMYPAQLVAIAAT